MARAKHSGFGLALALPLAMFVLTAVAQAADSPDWSPVCAAVLKAKPADWVAVDRVPAADADLVLGDGYTMEVRRGNAAETYSGPLVQVTDKWVVLRKMVVAGSDGGIPYPKDIPLIGGLFGHSTRLTQELDVWIPREAATIESHLKVAQRPAEMPHLTEAPPLDSECYVEVAAGDQVDVTRGMVTALGAAGLTMVSHSNDGNQAWRISRGELLVVSVLHTVPLIASTETSKKH
jgi:hypothetical protein